MIPPLEPIEDVDYVLEATSEEFYLLWVVDHEKMKSWDHRKEGRIVTIGFIGRRPICMTYGYATINNRKILVWELTSQLADYKMAEKWLTKYCSTYRNNKYCNAANFHHIFNS